MGAAGGAPRVRRRPRRPQGHAVLPAGAGGRAPGAPPYPLLPKSDPINPICIRAAARAASRAACQRRQQGPARHQRLRVLPDARGCALGRARGARHRAKRRSARAVWRPAREVGSQRRRAPALPLPPGGGSHTAHWLIQLVLHRLRPLYPGADAPHPAAARRRWTASARSGRRSGGGARRRARRSDARAARPSAPRRARRPRPSRRSCSARPACARRAAGAGLTVTLPCIPYDVAAAARLHTIAAAAGATAGPDACGRVTGETVGGGGPPPPPPPPLTPCDCSSSASWRCQRAAS